MSSLASTPRCGAEVEELSLPFVLAQYGTRQCSLRYRHSYASVVSPSPRLRESGALMVSCGQLHPDCIHFSCCSLTAPASAAVPQLHLLQLLFPNFVRFSCCSPILSTSAAAPQMHPLLLLLECVRLLSRTRSTKCNKYEGRKSLL